MGDVPPQRQHDAVVHARHAQHAVIAGGRRPHSVALVAAASVALALFLIFVALGNWQLQRRAWKLDLIARVEQRVHAPPVKAPTPEQWSGITPAKDEYRRVEVAGTFISGADTLVQAVTDLGPGFWLLTPLQATDGTVVLINRGFVPPEWRAFAASRAPADMISVVGLLRMTEPGGGFLRRNDPHRDRWHSRDVEAIAAARGLTRVAPYFIDADRQRAIADSGNGTLTATPVGGLTVVSFRNNHLEYAITWYTLALMVVGGAWVAIREGRARR